MLGPIGVAAVIAASVAAFNAAPALAHNYHHGKKGDQSISYTVNGQCVDGKTLEELFGEHAWEVKEYLEHHPDATLTVYVVKHVKVDGEWTRTVIKYTITKDCVSAPAYEPPPPTNGIFSYGATQAAGGLKTLQCTGADGDGTVKLDGVYTVNDVYAVPGNVAGAPHEYTNQGEFSLVRSVGGPPQGTHTTGDYVPNASDPAKPGTVVSGAQFVDKCGAYQKVAFN